MRNRSKKSDKRTVNNRIISIASMLVNGCNIPYILQYSSENWGIGERMTRTYISRANTIIDENRQEDVRKKLILHDARLELLFNQSFENGDFKQCFDVLKEIDSFNGLKKIRQSQQENKWQIDKGNSDRPEDSFTKVLASGFN